MQSRDARTPWMAAGEERQHLLDARRGDRGAFLVLLRHYHRPLHRLAFALTRDVRAAVVRTHEAAALAGDGIRRIPEGQRFLPWVVRHLRVRAHSRPSDPGWAPATAIAASWDPLVAEVAQNHLRALDDLDVDTRTALSLRVVERLTYGQIESVLGTVPGTALVMVAEARARVRGEPEPEGPGADHLTHHQISAHVDGYLQGGFLESADRHLGVCRACRERRAAHGATHHLLTALLTHEPPEEFFERTFGHLEEQIRRGRASKAAALPPGLSLDVAREVARHESDRWPLIARRAMSLRSIRSPSPVAPPGREAPPTVESQAPAESTAQATEVPAAPAEVRDPHERTAERSPALLGAGAMILLAAMVGGVLLWNQPATDETGEPVVFDGGVDATLDSVEPAEPASSAAPEAAPVTSESPAPAPAVRVPKRSAAASVAATPTPPAAAARKPAATPRPSPESARISPPADDPGSRGLLCGTVRDEAGQPVARAQVLVAELSLVTVTDGRGRFCVSASGGERIVAVSAPGFVTELMRVAVGEQTGELSVILRPFAAPAPSGVAP